MASYSYTLSTDFGGGFNGTNLFDELTEAGVSGLGNIASEEAQDMVTVEADPGQQSLIDSVVSSHDPAPDSASSLTVFVEDAIGPLGSGQILVSDGAGGWTTPDIAAVATSGSYNDLLDAPSSSSPPSISLYNNQSQSYTGTTTIKVSTEHLPSSADFDVSSAGEVEIAEAGRYLISYSLSVEASKNKTGVRVWLEIGGSEVTGTRRESYIDRKDNSNTSSSLIIYSLGAGDTVRLRSRRIEGNGSLSLGTGDAGLVLLKVD